MAAGDVLLSFSSPGAAPLGLAWGGRGLWHCDSDDDLIYLLDAGG